MARWTHGEKCSNCGKPLSTHHKSKTGLCKHCYATTPKKFLKTLKPIAVIYHG